MKRVETGDPYCTTICADNLNFMRNAGIAQQFGRNQQNNDSEQQREASLLFWVFNSTVNNLNRGNIVEITTPHFSLPSANSTAGRERMFERPTFQISAPASTTSQVAIVADPLIPNGVGRAVISGAYLTKCTVNATTDGWLEPIVGNTDQLNSTSTRTNIRILWKEAGTGADKYCFARLSNNPETKAGIIRFSLSASLAVTDATASVTVLDYYQGTDPGALTTINNLPISTDYLFNGVTGDVGLAFADGSANKYTIFQLEC